MRFHWHQEGDDLVVYVSGSLIWNSEFQQLCGQFQVELRRFMWAASGWVIVDLSEASEVDPRCVHSILEVLSPLKEMERVALRGRESAIATLFADVGIPWIVEDPGTVPDSADTNRHSRSEPWSSIFESLFEEDQVSDSAWASSAEKIEQMVDNLDAAESERSQTSPGDFDLRAEDEVNPVLWFADGDDQPIAPGPGSVAIPKQRSSRTSSSPTPIPTEDEVFDWFFTIGQKAVDREFGESNTTLQESQDKLVERQIEGDSPFRGDSILEGDPAAAQCPQAGDARSLKSGERGYEAPAPKAPQFPAAENIASGREDELDPHVAGSEFEIDLELEKLYLSKNPSRRDQEGSTQPVQFISNWQSLQPGSTYVRAEKKSRHHPDPVDLLGGLAGPDSDVARSSSGPQSTKEPNKPRYEHSQPPKPIALASDEREGGLDLPRAPGNRTNSEDSISFGELFARAAGNRTRSTSSYADQSDAMHQGIAEFFLAEIEKSRREKSELIAETKRLSGEVLEAREMIAKLNEQISSLEKKQQDVPDPGSALPGWQLALDQTPLNSQVLRNRFTSAMKRFHASGTVEPDRILEEIEQFHLGSGSIAASLATQIDRARSETDDGWRPMLLLASTLVREGVDEARRKRAIRIGWLASLVRNSPGRDRREINFVATPVIRLLKSPAYRFAEESGAEFNPQELEQDLALWYACVRIDERRHLASDRWRTAIARTLEKYESDQAVRSGLVRLVEAHSLYLPGSWVELSSGAVGLVLASTHTRPEYPQVLVMFQREGRSLVGTDPHWVRTGETANSGVLRGVRNPHLSEDGRISPTIDTGGSVVLPKMK